MAAKTKILQQAEFNPRIKRYLLIYGMLISVITIVGIPLLPIYFVVAPIMIKKYFNHLST
jgi:putative membrane protein